MSEEKKHEKHSEEEAKEKEESVKNSSGEKKENVPEDDKEAEEKEKKEGNSASLDEKEAAKAKAAREDKKEEQYKAKIDELNDKYMRQMAEFDNFRKRTEKEKKAMFDMGCTDIIAKMLPVIDNFERGLSSVDEGKKDDPFVQGIDKVYKQLVKVLDDAGVKPIETVGKEFDPKLHNAVMHTEDDSVGENTIVEELQKGYMYHDTVVRPSMVKVAN